MSNEGTIVATKQFSPLRWLKLQRRRLLGIERAVAVPVDVQGAADRGLAIEIGGPTPFFESTGFFPVYRFVEGFKIFNFASATRWESNVQVQVNGRVIFIETAEAASIPLPDGGASLILSSHVIEHLANPLAGMLELRRILAPDGRLVMIVPHRDGTYDHRRPVTTLAHLEQDMAVQMEESDSTHFDEILQLHDLKRDATTPSKDVLEKDVVANINTRFCHHHVFDTRLALSLLDRAGMEPTLLELIRPYHILMVAKAKSADGQALPSADIALRLKRSPFQSDRSR